MTIETMLNVKEELAKRNILAYVEYPGWINILIASEHGDFQLACGDANEDFAIDINQMPEGKFLDAVQSNIPYESTDVQRVADFIEGVYLKQIGGRSIA